MAWTIPRTWVAGEVVTAANVNTHLRDNLLAISGAWVAFTTTWSGTIGNGTKASVYTRIGRTIHYRISIAWGSSTSHAAATQSLTLPVLEAAGISSIVFPMGITTVYDQNLNAPGGFGWAILSAAQTIVMQSHLSAAGTYFTNTAPMTWTTGDVLYVTGTYEANTD